jgi:hypothetical protein
MMAFFAAKYAEASGPAQLNSCGLKTFKNSQLEPFLLPLPGYVFSK